MINIQKRLKQIEKELEKVRTSSFVDGWQTQRHAKKARKWDMLAIEKFYLQQSLENVINCKYYNHNENIFNFGRCICCNETHERIIK